jgi:hypothetical protein
VSTQIQSEQRRLAAAALANNSAKYPLWSGSDRIAARQRDGALGQEGTCVFGWPVARDRVGDGLGRISDVSEFSGVAFAEHHGGVNETDRRVGLGARLWLTLFWIESGP